MDTTILELPVVAFLYKLIIGERWYVGSSTQSIQDRMKNHYQQGLRTPDRKLYKAVAEFGGWTNVKIEILTTLPFTSKEDLWKEEDKHLNLKDPLCLNSFRAVLSEEERKEQKKEVSSRCKKVLYAKRKEDSEWIKKERERARALYAKRKDDPTFAEKRRQSAIASYHRRKGSKKDCVEKE